MTAPHPPEAQGDQARRIAGYEILSKLGQGGMGAVYKAKQLSLDRLVALKVLPRQLTASQDFIQRFSREARVTGQLNHPNIIKVFDVGRSNTGICYYSMEYVEGENLRSVLDREKRLGPGTVLKVLEEMASALAHAHKHGIIHRDIKPDNILIDREGASKLADLGLAKVAEDASATAAAKGGAYASIAGQVVGTPYYMSPEQAEGLTVDTRSDLYSLGATAYHLLAGVPPFTAETPMGVITKHLTEPVPSVMAKVPGIPASVDVLLKRLMAKLPAERFQTPGDLLSEVSRIRREPLTPVPPPTVARAAEPASRTPLLVGGGVLLAVLAVTAYAMRRKDPVVPTPPAVASVPAMTPEQKRERDAQAAKYAAENLSGPALLDALREMSGKWPGTNAAQWANRRLADIQQHDRYLQIMKEVARHRGDGNLREAMAAMEGFQPSSDDHDEFERVHREIQEALNAPPPPAPVAQVPPPPPPSPPPPAASSHGPEIRARLEEIRKADRAHDWEQVLKFALPLQTEMALEMQPGDLDALKGLLDRASRNRTQARRWGFDAGVEGWAPGASLPAADGKAREPSGSLASKDQALRFGAADKGGRWGGEVRSPPFTLQPGARLSLTWTLSLLPGAGRPPQRGSKAYACLRDEKGKLLGILRSHPLRGDWRGGKREVSLNFRSEPLSADREAQVRLCFGFCTDDPPGRWASMKLDDIELFYGEDMK